MLKRLFKSVYHVQMVKTRSDVSDQQRNGTVNIVAGSLQRLRCPRLVKTHGRQLCEPLWAGLRQLLLFLLLRCLHKAVKPEVTTVDTGMTRA